MTLLKLALENWDSILALAAVLGGALGLQRRTGRRREQLERALGTALYLLRTLLDGLRASGRLATDADVDEWLRRFETFAQAFGLTLAPAEWTRLLDAVKEEVARFNLERANTIWREHEPKLQELLRRIDTLKIGAGA
jgi:hypothetical protein